VSVAYVAISTATSDVLAAGVEVGSAGLSGKVGGSAEIRPIPVKTS